MSVFLRSEANARLALACRGIHPAPRSWQIGQSCDRERVFEAANNNQHRAGQAAGTCTLRGTKGQARAAAVQKRNAKDSERTVDRLGGSICRSIIETFGGRVCGSHSDGLLATFGFVLNQAEEAL